MVENLDSSDCEAKDASRTEGFEVSSKFSISVVGSSRGKERRKVTAPEGSWSFDSIRSSLS